MAVASSPRDAVTEAADPKGAAEAQTAVRADALEREQQHCLAIEKLETEHQHVGVPGWS